MTAQSFTLAEQALNAIWTNLRGGDWGNAERVLNEYAADVNAPAKALDRFAAVYGAPVSMYRPPAVADEIRCLDCGAVACQAGVVEPTLDQLMAVAARHECLPRVTATEES